MARFAPPGMQPAIQDLFLRFRDHGDAASLGELYDRAAPELLAAALRICRNASEAEDVLQSTFVTAMESARRFDRTRTILPWLYGILVLHAREARRRAGRQPDPERLPERAVPDPASVAADQDLRGRIEELVAELPSTYRAAVRAFLVEEKTPAQLARDLAVSSGTARVRLHRGLKLLRKALPSSLAPLLLADLLRRVAAVRPRVLEALPAPGGPAGGAERASLARAPRWAAGPRLLGAVAGGVALVAGAAVGIRALRADASRASREVAAAERGVAGAARTPTVAPIETGLAPAAARAPIAPPTVSEIPLDPAPAVVVRVVDARDGTPLAAEGFALLGLGPAGPVELPGARRLAAEARGDGTTLVRLSPRAAAAAAERTPERGRVLFVSTAAGLGWRAVSADVGAAGGPTVLELPVAPGALVDVRVVDPSGAPSAGVELELVPCSFPWPRDPAALLEPRAVGEGGDPFDRRLRARTDAAGSARLEAPRATVAGLAPRAGESGALVDSDGVRRILETPDPVDAGGPQHVLVRARPRDGGVAAPAELLLLEEEERVEVEIVVHPRAALGPRGVVLDARGRPVAGARVELEALRVGAPSHGLTTTCDPSGAFSFAAEPLPELPLRLAATAPDGSLAVLDLVDPAELALERVLELRIDDAVAIAGVVVDPAGRAVRGARVEALLAADSLAVCSDADGRFALRVPSGESVDLLVFPPAPEEAWVPATVLLLDPGPHADLRVALDLLPEPAGSVRAELVDERGDPVDVVQAFLLPFFEDETREYPAIHGDATRGAAVFEAVPPGFWNAWAHAADGSIGVTSVRVGRGPRPVETRIVLAGRASLAGRVLDPDGAELLVKWGAGILLPGLPGGPPPSRSVPLGTDGSFRVEGLASGPQLLLVHRDGELVAFVGLDLAPGENGPVAIPSAPAGTGPPRGDVGTLRVRSETPAPAGFGVLWVADDDGPWRLVDLVPTDGVTRTELSAELVAGAARWRACVLESFRVDAPELVLPQEGAAWIRAGETVEAVFPVLGSREDS